MEIKLKISLLFIVASFTMGCAKERLNASGKQVTEIRNTGAFKAVNVAGSSAVFISHGNECKVELKGSDNLISKFVTKVEGEELVLKYKDVNVVSDDLKIYIIMPSVVSIATNGTSSYEVSGNFPRQEKFAARVYGAGNINMLGNMPVANLDAEIKGSGNISVEKIMAEKAKIGISGSGNVTTSVSEKLQVDISGSGNVYYVGTPELTSKYSGSGRAISK